MGTAATCSSALLCVCTSCSRDTSGRGAVIRLAVCLLKAPLTNDQLHNINNYIYIRHSCLASLSSDPTHFRTPQHTATEAAVLPPYLLPPFPFGPSAALYVVICVCVWGTGAGGHGGRGGSEGFTG